MFLENERKDMRKFTMNTKLFSISAAAVSSVLAASVANADVSVSAELVHNGSTGGVTQPADVATYRLYANLDANWRVDAVYGNSDSSLDITANGLFYQNSFGSDSSAGINPALIFAFPSLAYDSWVSIGLEDQTGNALNNIGIDFGAFNSAGSLLTDNGSWFVTPDDIQGQEVDGRVLLGQFSVIDGSGVLTDDMAAMMVNVQGKDADGNTCNLIGGNALPAPGALALLGLAGVTARRRRK